MTDWGSDWGSDWGLTGTDHEEEILARFLEQYKGKTNWINLATIFAERAQAIHDLAIDVRDAFHPDNAVGEQQDYIGNRIGLDRAGFPDDDYRVQQNVQTHLLLPEGRSLISNQFALIREAIQDAISNIDIIEVFPLGYRIEVEDLSSAERSILVRFLPFCRPATYDAALVSYPAGGFVYDSSNPYTPTGGGYASVNNLSLGGGYAHVEQL